MITIIKFFLISNQLVTSIIESDILIIKIILLKNLDIIKFSRIIYIFSKFIHKNFHHISSKSNIIIKKTFSMKFRLIWILYYLETQNQNLNYYYIDFRSDRTNSITLPTNRHYVQKSLEYHRDSPRSVIGNIFPEDLLLLYI